MAAKSIADLDLQGRRVFIRVDFNVPLTPAGGVSDATRIRESLPTIVHAIERGARVVLASHLGRPKGRVRTELSLLPVAAYLAEALDRDVVLADEPAGDGAKKVVNDLRDGSVALLENLRFTPAEEANDENFSRVLASYADVYVNDAFGTAHRAHASTAGMVKYVANKGMGFLMDREVKILGKLLGEVAQPFVAVIGGAKVSDKIGLLESLLGRVSVVCLGGAMANTFLSAKGMAMGRALVETNKLAQFGSQGVVRAISPVNTMFDGDTTFALSLGARQADINALGVAAAEAVAQAILRAVKFAKTLGGVPGLG